MGKIAKSLIQKFVVKPGKPGAYEDAQASLFLDLMQLLTETHRFMLLGPTHDKAMACDNGFIVCDAVMKAVVVAKEAWKKLILLEQPAQAEPSQPENASATPLDPSTFAMVPVADGLSKHSLSGFAEKLFASEHLQIIFKIRSDIVMEPALGQLLEVRKLAAGYDKDGERHWWNSFDPDKTNDFAHVMEVATKTLGTVNGGTMKANLDQAAKAFARVRMQGLICWFWSS